MYHTCTINNIYVYGQPVDETYDSDEYAACNDHVYTSSDCVGIKLDYKRDMNIRVH